MNIANRLLTITALVCVLSARPFAAPVGFESTSPRYLAPNIGGSQSDARGPFEAAVELYRQRKFDESLAMCEEAARLRPNDYRPRALAGYIYMAQRKYKSASDAFASAILLESRDKQLYLMKATVDSGRNAKDEAIAACRKALELDPSFAEAYEMIGNTLRWDKTRQSEAIAAYRSAIKFNPRLLTSYEPLGRLLEQSNDQKSGEEVFRQGMAADPKHMICRFAFGRMLVKQGRLVEAREVWAGRTSDTDNTFPNFIVLLTRAENLKRATDALAQKPNDPEALVDMGLAVMDGDSWVGDGRQERAMVHFKKALELRPGYARAQYAICKGYIQLASIFRDKSRIVDEELVKLRQLDPGLAVELEEYRKNYVGGIPGGVPVNLNK